jgi:hypothetical protein
MRVRSPCGSHSAACSIRSTRKAALLSPTVLLPRSATQSPLLSIVCESNCRKAVPILAPTQHLMSLLGGNAIEKGVQSGLDSASGLAGCQAHGWNKLTPQRQSRRVLPADRRSEIGSRRSTLHKAVERPVDIGTSNDIAVVEACDERDPLKADSLAWIAAREESEAQSVSAERKRDKPLDIQ